MPTNIGWGAPCPSGDYPLIPIYRAVPGTYIRLVAVCGSIETVRLHFCPPGVLGAKPRTLPCTGDDECAGCRTLRLPRRWYGYLGSWDPLLGRVVIAELTTGAVRTCQIQLFRQPAGLRGFPFKMWRRTKSKTSPVRVAFDLPQIDTGSLPPVFNVRAALARIWGVEGE
jgi:hypothetical protein